MIINGLNLIISNICNYAKIQPNDILEVTLVGNTCRHYLFLKIDPQFIGRSPFPTAIHNSVDVKARELGLKINDSGYVHALPIEAGFVGADNVGVLIAYEPWKKSEIQLIIDIGTNGEIVLGNNSGLSSCSCATGPAFEGAHIKFGMRAAAGSIEQIEIEPETYDVSYETIENENPRKILMKKFSTTQLDKVILAGAFGTYLNKEDASVIGLYPDCDLKKVTSIGNAAGEGARLALLNKNKREEAKKIVKTVKYIELTIEPDFEKEFMSAMYFPHMNDSFPSIQHLIENIRNPKTS